MLTASTALQATTPVTAGKKIPLHTAQTAHEQYWATVENNELTGDHCPKLALFSLNALQHYLREVEREFDRMGIPPQDRGVAVLPVLHEGATRFNLLFTPAVKDEGNKVHHILNEGTTGSDPDEAWDWVLGGFNDGQLYP